MTLDPSVIRSIPLADGTPGQLGPRLAGISGDGNDVVVTDLATGSVTSVSAHVRGHQEVLSVELSGNHLVWATGAWASYEPGVAPCSVGGAVSWTVWARDLEAGTDAEIAMGKNTDTESCAAYCPDIAVDGDLLAYAVEDHERASKEATTLVIRSLVTGEIVRTVDTDLYIEDLAISDEDVAFIDGHLSTDPYSDIESPRLIVSTTDSPALRLIETGQYVDSLSFVNGRLAWLGDEADDEEVWTADVKDLKPVALTHDGDRRYSDPYSSGDYVVWSDGPLYYFGTRIDVWSQHDSTIHSVVPFPSSYSSTGEPLAPEPGAGEVYSAWVDGSWLLWNGSIFKSAAEYSDVLQGCLLSDAGIS